MSFVERTFIMDRERSFFVVYVLIFSFRCFGVFAGIHTEDETIARRFLKRRLTDLEGVSLLLFSTPPLLISIERYLDIPVLHT